MPSRRPSGPGTTAAALTSCASGAQVPTSGAGWSGRGERGADGRHSRRGVRGRGQAQAEVGTVGDRPQRLLGQAHRHRLPPLSACFVRSAARAHRRVRPRTPATMAVAPTSQRRCASPPQLVLTDPHEVLLSRGEEQAARGHEGLDLGHQARGGQVVRRAVVGRPLRRRARPAGAPPRHRGPRSPSCGGGSTS